ncbi:MAG: O-antigen ligase family protein [Candidatus Pacebacteria bacterium]|nr:O-antigen ligase family protein [Candidatus Paceibacterota bacterium]
MFIPVSWFYLMKFWHEKEKNCFILMVVLLVLFLFNLLASFGRVVIFIGFLEVILLGVLSYKKFISQRRIFKYIYSLFVLLFIIVLSIKLIISLLSIFKNDFSCQVPFLPSYEEKICKDLSQEARIYYWQTALIAIRDNWQVGYGPGTYGLINIKYKNISNYASDAHNAYLQSFAENGIAFFLLFVWLMGMSWFLSAKAALPKLSYKKVKTGQNNLSLEQALFIGISAIYLDVLFDFDWSFLGIYIVTLIFIVLIIRYQSESDKNKITRNNIIFSKLIRVVFILIGSILFLLSLVSIGVESLIYLEKTNQAMQFFPYFQIHMKLFANDESLSKENIRRLDDIYSNYSDYYLLKDQEEVLTVYVDRITEIDPWYYYSFSVLDKLYKTHPELVEKELVKLNDILDKARENGHEGSYIINSNLAELASKIGDEYLYNGELKKASSFYLLGFNFHNWLWTNTVPAFVYLPLPNEEKTEFWSYLSSVNVDFFAKNKADIAKSYFTFADEYLAEKKVKEFAEIIDKINQFAPWIYEDYLSENESIIQEWIDQLIGQGKLNESEQLLNKLNNLKYSYWAKTQLGNFYLLQNRDQEALQLFKKCDEEWQRDMQMGLHGDCHYGAISVEENWINRDRYYQVSKIIRGESIWEDFVE